MHITQIDIQHLEFEAAQNVVRGCVALVSKASRIHVDCIIPGTDAAAPAQQKSALINEAIRQLRRMPEFRRNESAVTFANNLAFA